MQTVPKQSDLSPDSWVVMEFKGDFCVCAGWSGGYLDEDRWRRSSAIQSVEDKGEHWFVTTYTGSSYNLHKESQAVRMNNGSLVQRMENIGARIVPVEYALETLKERTDG